MQITTENVGDMVAYWQNGRPVTYREVTTEDLKTESLRYGTPEARAELSRRGIDWTKLRHARCQCGDGVQDTGADRRKVEVLRHGDDCPLA